MPDTTTHRGELRVVPLSAIRVRDGFNPRTHFDEAALERMADTIADIGMLQPLLVRPADTDGEYELVDGERRYRAAFQAGLTEAPVLIRAHEEQTGGLVAALAANFHRADHTPVEEANAYKRLLDAGLTRKGICERLQASRELVRERLEILELPDELHPSIDDGSIPLGAVKPLAALAKIHPGLPACAARRVNRPPREAWRRALTWADVVEDPIGAVTTRYGDEQPELPDGVFEGGASYPLSAFALPERAAKELAALARLNPAWATEEERLTFGRELVEQAAALGAAHSSPHGHSALIVGQDVADQLAADYVKAQLKSERARARREREQRTRAAEAAGQDAEVAAAGGPDAEQQAKERRRAERQAELERRGAAQAHNGELGIAVLKAFAKVAVDERVLRVLSAVDFNDDLEGLAARGARYGFPGWPKEETTKAGKPKIAYLERWEARTKAHEFLAGAGAASEIAGRCLALVVMAALADEDCVAQSGRSRFSMYAYRPSPYGGGHEHDGGVPWRRQVLELVEELALERLPEHLTAAVRERREQARREREQREAAERAAAAADDELRARLADMAPEQRLEALQAFGAEHGRHTARAQHLREHILTLNASANSDAGAGGGEDAPPAVTEAAPDTGTPATEAPAGADGEAAAAA